MVIVENVIVPNSKVTAMSTSVVAFGLFCVSFDGGEVSGDVVGFVSVESTAVYWYVLAVNPRLPNPPIA